MFVRMHQFAGRHNYTQISVYLSVQRSFILLNKLKMIDFTFNKS